MKESLNIVSLLAELLGNSPVAKYLILWENFLFSLAAILIICAIAYLASRRITQIPTGLQNACELFTGAIDDFVCGILGPGGRKYTPFLGTLFIYILVMNLLGLIPFMKSSTASWSTTLALALCVFVYVQYTAFKELGFLGYIDHLMDKPRGILAFSVVIPLLLLCLHIMSELIKPISLSLRLRSNIWGDDMLLTMLSGLGMKGIPLLLFNMPLAIVASLVQALVFTLLATIYFALILTEEAEHSG